jgi:hypothetical protein
MFQWYAGAEVCYAYLNDVKGPELSSLDAYDGLERSKWFERGWTLQELPAPSQMYFVPSDWSTILGSETDLAGPIAAISRIHEELLKDDWHPSLSLGNYSVAQRMSWAADRLCTRYEVRTYWLMGLFDVNMPLLYSDGGRRAFLGLQYDILKISDDESIFTWPSKGPPLYLGMLAASP